MAERRTAPWVAFLAGVVATVVVGLLWWAWQGRDGATRAAGAAMRATDGLPALERPRLPEAPRMPDAPIPIPR